jgi:hypothetical protein
MAVRLSSWIPARLRSGIAVSASPEMTRSCRQDTRRSTDDVE